MSGDYAARAAAHAAGRDAELERSRLISRLRLTTFLPALGCFLVAISGHALFALLVISAALFLVFGVLVVWHARVEERAAWHDALRLANVHARARVERDWDSLPPGEAPAAVDLEKHPYALDLDLFGRASLFRWLGPAATPGGAAALGGWLLSPAAPAEVRARQEAVAELAPLAEWREQFAAHGALAAGASRIEIDRFLEWAEVPGAPSLHNRPIVVVVLALTASIWILFLLWLMGVLAGGYWLVPVMAGLVLSFAMAKTVHETFHRAGTGQQALGRYAAIFEHAVSPRFSTAPLRAIQTRLSGDGVPAPACMRALNRVLGFAELRTGAAMLHFVIQGMTLWDFHVAFALERWRRRAGPHVRGWMTAVGDLDALSALAAARFDNPAWAVPDIDPEARMVADALGHPLIPDSRRVPNDVEIGPAGTLLLVTGSNMSGKSTLLRAIGLNAVLAQAGGVVCATRMRMPPADLQTSIRVQDSLELGLSYFMAALARLKGVVDAAEHPRPGRTLLYLLDEILQGTNSAERSIAVRAVARHLLEAGAIGAMTTHDLSLAQEEPLNTAARLVHFSETVVADGTMHFDYTLREGLATSRNALRLMQLIGIDL
jgi:MutS domain V